jgi:hypothetical protein
MRCRRSTSRCSSISSACFELRLRLLDRDGAEGTTVVAGAAIERVPAEEKDEAVTEIVFVAGAPTAVVHNRDLTTLTLAAPLAHVYDRPATSVNANVARATHGETVNEILGSGDARQPNARFALRQFPLTHVSAPTPTGRRAELAVRANDLLWTEVPSLYARGPTDRVYEVRIDDDAHASVLFGDGIEGSRLPSGDHNVRATYRKGLGLAGNVAAGKIRNLLSRPLGVTGARNPAPATGGRIRDDRPGAHERAAHRAHARARCRSATTRTSRAFAGIAKAHALWIPSGRRAAMFLTVAGELGAAKSRRQRHVREPSGGAASLRRSADAARAQELPRRALPRARAIKVADDADAALVLPAVEARLRAAFGFEARGFGQGVSVDEVSAARTASPAWSRSTSPSCTAASRRRPRSCRASSPSFRSPRSSPCRSLPSC